MAPLTGAKDGPVSVAYGMKKDRFHWKVSVRSIHLILSLIPRHPNSSKISPEV